MIASGTKWNLTVTDKNCYVRGTDGEYITQRGIEFKAKHQRERVVEICQLIAAAPDMLEALTVATSHLKGLVCMIRDNDLARWNSNGTCKTIEEVEALLEAIANPHENHE